MKTSLVLFVAAHTSLALAQSSGTFAETGKMTTARYNHTATLMQDGSVLIVGGATIEGAGPVPQFKTLATAELYDPTSGVFSPTGSLKEPRQGHTATLLPDGKVLVTGGAHSVYAELYDPDTRSFDVIGVMTTARTGHTATLLNNGKVLIAGGASWPSAELYEPSTRTFIPTGNMTSVWRIATPLPDGRVLFLPAGDVDDPTAAIYDPETGSFRSIDWKTSFSVAGTAATLPDGNVMVTLNAQECDSLISTALLYDRSRDVFLPLGRMAHDTCNPTGTLLSNGTVLIAGGRFAFGFRAQIYDPVSGAFSIVGEMSTGRHDHSATLLNDGRVLVAGGFYSSEYYTLLASAEIYHPSSIVPAPLLLSPSGDGRGQGAILHAGTGELASSNRPAIAGEALEIYCVGLLDAAVVPPQVSIGGRMADVLFFGKAPRWNLNQVNVRVPNDVAPGSAISVRMTYLGRHSNEVTIGVR